MGGQNKTTILRWSSDFLPELRAEDVPYGRAEAEMLRYQTRRNPEGLFLSAWNHVEFAMNRAPLSEEVRDSYFDLAQHLIQRAIGNHVAHQNTQLKSLILSSYIPLFRKRILNETVVADDAANIYTSLGRAMSYVRPLDIEEPPQWEMMEAAVLALSARTRQPDLMLYPASPREESSPHDWSNHDSYFYGEDGKIPVQQKLIHTDREYADWMTVLTVMPIVEKAFKRSGVTTEMTSRKINYLLSLIVLETADQPLSEDEQRFLNIMSSAVVSHRWANSRVNVKAAA